MIKHMTLLKRMHDTDGDNRFYCSGAPTLANLAELEEAGLVKRYAGIDAHGARHFRITAAGKRAIVAKK